MVVEYDGVDGGGGQSVEISSKVEKLPSPKNLKGLENLQGHRFGGTFTKAPILPSIPVKFAELENCLNTAFRSIIEGGDAWQDGWEDVEGIMHHQGLSYVRSSELTSHFGIEKTRELVARNYYLGPAVATDT